MLQKKTNKKKRACIAEWKCTHSYESSVSDYKIIISCFGFINIPINGNKTWNNNITYSVNLKFQ